MVEIVLKCKKCQKEYPTSRMFCMRCGNRMMWNKTIEDLR
jgi:rRNA maturation endonuclease Nob1